jgi:PST family polysaccharide transporter
MSLSEPDNRGVGGSTRASAIIVVAQGGALVVQLLSIVLLSRILKPSDFGLFSMCLVVLGASEVFQNFGFSAATVQIDKLSRELQSNLFWINVSMGVVLMCALIFSAEYIAYLFNEERLGLMLLVLSPAILLSAISAQHAANLKREIKVGRLASIDLISSILSLCVAVTFGLIGYGYWSLIFAIIARGLCRAILLNCYSGFIPQRPSLQENMGMVFSFGANVTLYNVLEYVHRNVDNYLIGRNLGVSSLAIYSRSYSLISVVLRACKSVSFGVFFPMLSRLKGDPVEYRQYYLNMSRVVSLVAGFVAALTFTLSEEIVYLALGKGWEDVSPILQLFAVVLFFQIIDLNRNAVLLSLGEGKRYARSGGVQTLFSVIGILCGLPWGVYGVSVGYVVGSVLSFVVLYSCCMNGTPVGFWQTLNAMTFPILAGVGGSCVSLLLDVEVLKGESFISAFILKMLVVAILFLLLALTHPVYRKDTVALIKNLKKRNSS